MAGAKYSPGFDDPSARRTRVRTRGGIAAMVLAALFGVTALGVTFAAYLDPSLAVDFGSVMAFCAQAIGLR